MSNGLDNKNGCNLHLFERNNYFYGKLMTVRDFEAEQGYFNGKRRLMNRLVSGPGIVCGFSVGKMTITPGEKYSITFQEGGIALDSAGREIVVPENTTREITLNGQTLSVDGNYYLYLKYKPCLAEMVNAASSQSSCDESCCPNRTREDFEVIARITPPDTPSYPPETDCPKTPDSQGIEETVKKFLETCPGCKDTEVFFAYKNSGNGIDPDKSEKYRTYVFSNRLLEQLVTCHLTESNPHKLGFDVGTDPDHTFFDSDGLIHLDHKETDAITLESTVDSIIVSETHSGITGNPHQTDHSQVAPEGYTISDPTELTPDKHIANVDAARWNRSVRTVFFKDDPSAVVSPTDDGKFKIVGGNNVTLTGITNGITISATGGGLKNIHKKIQIPLAQMNEMRETIRLIDIQLPEDLYYGIILGTELFHKGVAKTNEILPSGIPSIIFADAFLASYGIQIYSLLYVNPKNKWVLRIVIVLLENFNVRSFIGSFDIEKIFVHYWAIPAPIDIPIPIEPIEPIEPIGPIPTELPRRILDTLAEKPNLTIKALASRLDTSEKEIKTTLSGLKKGRKVTSDTKGRYRLVPS